MLTKEEKAALERQRAEAKFRCREVWGTLQQLNAITSSYKAIHQRWKQRAEKTDRLLAEENVEIVTGMSSEKKVSEEDGLHLLVKLDQSQLDRVAKMLGVDLKKGGE